MARIRVIADDGWVALDEHASSEQVRSDHYVRCLGDRIRWAVEDADARLRIVPEGAAAGDEGAEPEAVLEAS